MKDLIEALQIFLKYGNPNHPTHCEHDILHICGIEPDDVSHEDKAKLDKLGFHLEEPDGHGFVENEGFYSFKYGSA